MRYPHRDLRAFIRVLEKEGELKRIDAPVDPVLEVAEIADRVSKRMGPALLFENPKGSEHPLLINALGSYNRMNLASGRRFGGSDCGPDRGDAGPEGPFGWRWTS